MNPLLSVIVPVYNVEKYLLRCLNSILSQSYNNIEIILIDDGSTDSSSRLCDEAALRDNRITVIHKINEGLGLARNTGIENAIGKYLSFIDSDDYIEPDMFKNMVSRILETNADLCYCNFQVVKDNQEKIQMKWNWKYDILENENVINKLLFNILGTLPFEKKDSNFNMSVCKGIFSKDIIDKYNIRFTSERINICEDLIFDIDFLICSSKVALIPNCYYNYCDNGSSLTHRYIRNRINLETVLYQEVLRRMNKYNDNDEFLLRYNRMFLGRVRNCIIQEAKYNNMDDFKKILGNIKNIANNDIVHDIIKAYPFNKNPIKQKIFNFCLKHKWSLFMFILAYSTK